MGILAFSVYCMLSFYFLCIFVDLTWLSMLFMAILLGSLDGSICFHTFSFRSFLQCAMLFRTSFGYLLGIHR